jgi:miniconductance mechanosensitive channel
MNEIIKSWLISKELTAQTSELLSWLILAIVVLLVAYIFNLIAKRVILRVVSYFIKKSRTSWDDVLHQRKVFVRLSHLAPALVIYFTAALFPPVQDFLLRLSMVYMIAVGLLVINAFLNAVVDIYGTFEISRQRPIKGYIQIAKIIFFIFVGIVIISVILDRSPLLLLSGLGAMTAILLLLFKDSILGLVASVQLSQNDMIRIGDWIEMPKYGADGDIIDVTLTTVKVQNWDKTITSIPAYSLVSDSFKNWRGMSESGGRRIKRSIHIDMNSVKFCSDLMLQKFNKYQLIKDYIQSKKEEIERYNAENNIDSSELINGRNMTNLGTFRAYLVAYLKNHPNINQDMTFLIRHLPPGPNGLPIEIYVFSNDQVWANYEAIQADIFDHILAVIPLFELRVFQNPSGNDFRTLMKATSE